MRSKSDRHVPKFEPMPVSGPVTQTDPFTWIPAKHGSPCWFKPFVRHVHVTPFYTPRAIAEAALAKVSLHEKLDLGLCTILELRARKNPWHPSGRLERVTVRAETGDVFVLKFGGDGEQIECLSVAARPIPVTPPAPIVRNPKYKGPRANGDTKSAISGKALKLP